MKRLGLGSSRRMRAATIAGVGVGALMIPVAATASFTAMTFKLAPCPGSGSTGSASVTISQTAKSLTIVDRVSRDLPDAGAFVVLADGGNIFGGFPLDSSGSALFEVHQTTTLPTGVSPGDSIVLQTVTGTPNGDTFRTVMASDPANCPG